MKERDQVESLSCIWYIYDMHMTHIIYTYVHLDDHDMDMLDGRHVYVDVCVCGFGFGFGKIEFPSFFCMSSCI
jgi:hypothetical protein